MINACLCSHSVKFCEKQFLHKAGSSKNVGIINVPWLHVGESHFQYFLCIFWSVGNSLNHCIRYLTDWCFVCDIRGPCNCQRIPITAKLSLRNCAIIYNQRSQAKYREKTIKNTTAFQKAYWRSNSVILMINVFAILS